MKKSVELKNERAQKVERMQAITSGAETAKRDLSPEETTEFDNLTTDCETLDKEIERAEKWEARQIQIVGTSAPKATEFERESKRYSLAKAMREFASGYSADKLTGREKEVHDELSRDIKSSGLILPMSYRANENTTTTHASILNTQLDTSLSIIGKEPMHTQMGITVMSGLTGNVKLPLKSPSVAQQVAIGTALANNSDNPTHVDLTPLRFGDQDVWDNDLIKTQNDAIYQAILSDMLKGCDRKLTAKLYAVAIAAATTVTSAAITEAGLNLMMAKITGDGNWGFAMDAESFWTGAGQAFTGSGSGKTLMEYTKPGFGRHANGTPAYFSSLFDDGTAKQFVLLADWAQFVLGEWGGLELLIDPYTYASEGRLKVTLNKIANIVCRNTGAVWISPDLDSN